MSVQWEIANKFSINYYPDVNEKFPLYRNSWNGEISTFRVTGFYKIVEPEVIEHNNDFLHEVIEEIKKERFDSKTELEKLKHSFSVVLELCHFEEADFIHGQSVSYPTVPIDWCNHLGNVEWDDEYIEKINKRCNPHSPSMWANSASRSSHQVAYIHPMRYIK